MLNVVFKPHRTHLKAGTADVQKVFAMLQLIPKPEVAQARPPLALALVIDTSGSMQEYADQQRAQEEIQRQGMQGQQQATGDGSYQVFDLSLETKLDQAIAAAYALIDDIRLSPGDQVAVIHFDDAAHPLLRLTPSPINTLPTRPSSPCGNTLGDPHCQGHALRTARIA